MPPSCSTLTGAELLQANTAVSMHKVTFGHVQLFVVLQTVACQASLIRGVSTKSTGVYWSILVATHSSFSSVQSLTVSDFCDTHESQQARLLVHHYL